MAIIVEVGNDKKAAILARNAKGELAHTGYLYRNAVEAAKMLDLCRKLQDACHFNLKAE